MLREELVSLGPVNLNVAASGAAGPPLLFVHGLSGRWQTWLPVMPTFAQRWAVQAVDLRGHGQSAHVDAYRAVDYAEDLITLLRLRCSEPAVLVGHSLGAIVAIAVAADAPALVRAVVLEDPPLGAFSDQTLAERSEHARFVATRELTASGAAPAALRSALAAMSPSADGAAIRARAVALASMDPRVWDWILSDRSKLDYHLYDRLPRVTAPTLLLQGNPALGGALDDARAATALAALADGTHAVMPNVGHGLHDDDPATFTRIVNAFLESL